MSAIPSLAFAIDDEDGLDTICNRCLRDYIDNDEFIVEALGALVHMAEDPDLCYKIAQESLDEIVGVSFQTALPTPVLTR